MNPLIEAYLDIYENLDEANKWEKKSGIGGKSAEAEFARSRSRAFHTGSPTPIRAVNPSDINSGTLLVNRGVARMIHKRNRGQSPSDPTYTHRRKIDPLKIPSYRDSPLGLPAGYKDPLRPRTNKNLGDKVNTNIKPLETGPNAKSNIRKFNREELEYIVDVLVSERFAADYEGAAYILEAMSDEWLDCILDDKYENI